jgi:hypothetical protein
MAKLSLKPPDWDQLWNFPKWLPASVRQAVESFAPQPAKIKKRGGKKKRSGINIQESRTIEARMMADEEFRSVMRKLTTDRHTRRAWRQLDKASLKPVPNRTESEQRQAFLHWYLFLSIWPGRPSKFWDTVPRAAEQKKHLERIAKLADRLRTDLGEFFPESPKDTRYNGWQPLSAYLSSPALPPELRSKLIHLQSESNRVGGDRSSLHGIHLIAVFGALPELLDTLQHLADFTSKQPTPRPPNRGIKKNRSAGAADDMIKQLITHAQHYLTRPCHKAIADTVNVALNLNPPLKSDDVRKRSRSPPRRPEPPPSGKNTRFFV